MNQNKHKNYSGYKISKEVPIIYPELNNAISALYKSSLDKTDSKEIGKNALNILKFQSESIYKKLYSKDNSNFMNQELKSIRNIYLTRLVESNKENFNDELAHNELKIQEISNEEKLNNLLEKLRETSKGEKTKKNNKIPNVSKNNSTNEEKLINDRTLKNAKIKKEEEKKEEKKENINNNSEEDENKESEGENSYDEENYINDDEGRSSDDALEDDQYDFDEGGEF